MTVALDLNVVQLLCSRLCHDLVGPVGAINNGLELVEELGGEAGNEAMELVASTAKQVSERLQYFRVAFGLAASAVQTTAEVRALLTPAVIGGKVQIVWPQADQKQPLVFDYNGVKLLLNMVMLAAEAMPRGGRLDVNVMKTPTSAIISVTANGQGARMDLEHQAAIQGTITSERMTPRNVQAYLAGRLAHHLGGGLFVTAASNDIVEFRAELPLKAAVAA